MRSWTSAALVAALSLGLSAQAPMSSDDDSKKATISQAVASALSTAGLHDGASASSTQRQDAAVSSSREAQVARASTGGKGGPTVDRERAYTHPGLALRSNYLLYAKHLKGKKPTGILIYLHGDGHGEYALNNPILQKYAGIARKRGMLMVAPKTPEEGSTPTWWKSESSTDWLRSFILHLYGTYDIDKNNVWFVGYSGGAEEITNFIVPANNDLFAGGGALMIGGGSFDQRIDVSMQLSAQQKSNFMMWWVVGGIDSPRLGGADGNFDALGESQRAKARYANEVGIEKTLWRSITDPKYDSHVESIKVGPGWLDEMISRR